MAVWVDLRDRSETAKKSLSQTTSTSIMVSAQGHHLVVEITREEFEALIAPIIARTREITERALAAAKLEPKDINDVLLVGGSTRILAVRAMLVELFGKTPRTDTNPDEAVGMGASIYAAHMGVDARIAVVDTQHRKVLPPPVEFVDVNSHPLGCLALENGEELNSVIIPANTPLPARKDDLFSLEREGQTAADIKIVQGAQGAKPAECTLIGTLVLSGMPRGFVEKRVKVTYGLTAEGTLEITGEDQLTKKCVSEIKRLDGLVTRQPKS